MRVCKNGGRHKSSFELLKRIIVFLCPLKGLAFLTQLMQRTGEIGEGKDKPAVIGTQANKPPNILGIGWHRPVLSSPLLADYMKSQGKGTSCTYYSDLQVRRCSC